MKLSELRALFPSSNARLLIFLPFFRFMPFVSLMCEFVSIHVQPAIRAHSLSPSPRSPHIQIKALCECLKRADFFCNLLFAQRSQQFQAFFASANRYKLSEI